MVEPGLADIFPGLRGSPFAITSPRDQNYNCIGFAAGDQSQWWWPDEDGDDFWPAGVSRAETIAAFRDAFQTLGYVECADDQVQRRPRQDDRQCRTTGLAPNGAWLGATSFAFFGSGAGHV